MHLFSETFCDSSRYKYGLALLNFFCISLVFSFVICNFLPYTVVIFGTCIIPPKRIWIPYFTLYPQRAYFPQMVGWMNPIYGHKKVVTGPCHCVQSHCILVVWFVHCSKLLARELSRAWNPAHSYPFPLIKLRARLVQGCICLKKRILVLCMTMLCAGWSVHLLDCTCPFFWLLPK